MKFALTSLSDEKTSEIEIEENETEQNQPAKLVEEINAITTLIIYHTFS